MINEQLGIHFNKYEYLLILYYVHRLQGTRIPYTKCVSVTGYFTRGNRKVKNQITEQLRKRSKKLEIKERGYDEDSLTQDLADVKVLNLPGA